MQEQIGTVLLTDETLIIDPNSYNYEIELDQIAKPNDLFHFLRHLEDKKWITEEMIEDAHKAVVKHWQRNTISPKKAIELISELSERNSDADYRAAVLEIVSKTSF